MLHTNRLRLAKAKNLHLAIFASHTNKAGYLCGANVEAYNNFICHSICYYLFISFLSCKQLDP